MADVEQIKQDILDLQAAQVGAVGELQALADQVAALKDAGASAVTDEQLSTLHDNLQSVTSALVTATQQAQGGLGGGGAPPEPTQLPAEGGDQPQVNPLT